jgi:hypothetical protein
VSNDEDVASGRRFFDVQGLHCKRSGNSRLSHLLALLHGCR